MNDNRIIPLLAGFILGAAICWLLMRSPNVSSPRLEQLVRDSAEYADKVRVRDSLYLDLWVEYTYKQDSLSSALDDLATARRRRPASRIGDSDSIVRAIEAELGVVR